MDMGWYGMEEEIRTQTSRLIRRLFPRLPRSFITDYWSNRRRYRWIEDETCLSICHMMLVLPIERGEDFTDPRSVWIRLDQA
eukprot:c34759_g1_i1 orf=1-246(+)